MPSRRELVALRELERLALEAQVDAGLVPDWARRPVTVTETRARVDFPAVMSVYTRAYDLADGVMTTFQRAIAADIAASIPAGADDRETSVAVTRWALRLTDGAAAARVAAVTALNGILEDVAAAGEDLLRQEAAMQGVLPEAFAGRRRNAQRSRARNIGRFEVDAGLAVEVAATKIQQSLLGAGQAADRAATLASIEGTKQAAALDSARQAAHIALGVGRADAAEELPPPLEVVASELLDEATCGPCERVDGTSYKTLAEGERDYPDSGPYRDCLGGARCRGMLVVVWE